MTRRPAPFRMEALEDRLAPRAGDLDLSFGDGGKVAIPGLSAVTDAAVMPDGRVVAVGSVITNGNTDFGVVRLTVNGTPDPTFGTNGLASLGFDLVSNGADTPAAVALRPDGGVVIVGSAEAAR